METQASVSELEKTSTNLYRPNRTIHSQYNTPRDIDTLCQLLAQIEDSVYSYEGSQKKWNYSFISKVYQDNIPTPVKSHNQNSPNNYSRITYWLDKPEIQKKIINYRRVFNTSKTSLLAEREELTSHLIKRFRKGKSAVRATDALQALRDREAVYGLVKGNNTEISIVLKDDRISSRINEIPIDCEAKDCGV